MNIDAGEFSTKLRAAIRALPDKSIKSYGISMDCNQVTINFKDGRKPVLITVPSDKGVDDRVLQVVEAVQNYPSKPQVNERGDETLEVDLNYIPNESRLKKAIEDNAKPAV